MMPDPIARLRRFNRAVTSELGVLDQSFLGRGRPLGPARVIHAIGAGTCEVSSIRDLLNIDKALLSRLLKGLEAEGLLTLAPDPADGRRRIATLTEAGAAEFAAYQSLSDDHAARLLARAPDAEALLAAMDLVANAFARDRVRIIQADPRSDDALYCLGEYYSELARRFERGFDVSLSRDPEAEAMKPPKGAFLMAMSDGLPLGCVGLKGGAEYGEVKRLWIAPAARRMGLSRAMMDAVEAEARALGLPLLRLDTNSALPEAVALYRATGWTEIPRYNDDPYPDVFFEKRG